MPDHIDGMLIARELADLKGRLTKQPFTHATLDKWLKEAPDRAKFFQNTFWGSIRWPKTLGRMPGRLSNGFSLKLQNEFDIKSVGAGGEIIDKTGWIDMPSPSMWDADDDETHYRVDYFGSCAKKTLTTVTNRLEIKIVGTWDNPGKFARFLLPNPLGYSFGNFDGRPIVLAEATVEQHLLTPKQPWKLPKLGKLIDS
jgi:hypothetical protein